MKLRNTLSLPMLCQLASSGMLICLAGYQVALSEKISNAVYCSNWESGVALVQGVRPRIMFVIARAQKSLALTAGGFFDLSLVTFTTVKTLW
ncbi:hypothetical protein RR48_12495 [Papilio machaon]|uniref:Uncharacterized protein n=1 Tax=Papilio machaon TaxID=76193 RepID=A0A194RNJ3_PAPMA|nr:hypothetical protein RR48_12495 [Papilio machaon]